MIGRRVSRFPDGGGGDLYLHMSGSTYGIVLLRRQGSKWCRRFGEGRAVRGLR